MQDLIPLLMTVLILALVLGLVTFISQVQPVKTLVVAAARNCARAGVESLAMGRGMRQALQTAVETAGRGLDLDNQAISAEGLAARAYTENVWGRGQVLVCETGFNVRVNHLPLVGWFYPGNYVPLRAKVSLSIEPYKARWD